VFSPDLAETTSFTVQEGDIIVLGTDGLFDNMKDEMIIKHIARLKVSFVFLLLNIIDFAILSIHLLKQYVHDRHQRVTICALT